MAGTAAETTATVAQLAAEVAQLRTALEAMTAERDRYRHLYEQLREAYAKLEQGLRGQLAERLPPDDRQLTLALLGTLLGADAPNASPVQPIRAHARRPPRGGRPCRTTCRASRSSSSRSTCSVKGSISSSASAPR